MKLKVTYTNFNVKVPRLVAKIYKVTPFGLPDGITADIFTAKAQILSASASGTPAVVTAPATDGLTLISDSSEASGWRTGTPSVDIEDNTNLIINGGFDFYQRNSSPSTDTTITDEKYGPDRWRCTRENANLQYSQQDASSESGLTSRYYGKFTKITSAGKFLIYQPLEFRHTIPLRGRTLSFQCKLKASSAKTIRMAILELQAAGTADTLPAAMVSAWGADSTDPTLGTNIAVCGSVEGKSVTTSWQAFSVSADVPSNSKNLIVAFWTDADFSASDILYIAEAGLYAGATIQTWTPRPVQQELLLCQRYCTVLGGPVSDTLGLTGYATAGSENQYSTLVYPMEMRTTPTATIATFAVVNCGQPTLVLASRCALFTITSTGAGRVTARSSTNPIPILLEAEL